MITALIIAVVLVSLALAALVVIAARLDQPHGRHRLDGEKTAAHFRSLRETPAPEQRPGQAPRPGDPPWGDAVRAGATTLSPGGTPVPPEAVQEPAPPAHAATLAQPGTSPAGPGQHPFMPVIMQFPGGEVGILGADGHWHIKPLAFDGRSPRETGGQPALVRPGRLAHEAWRDGAVNEL